MGVVSVSVEQILGWTLSLVWPFVRISAMLLVAPVFGSRTLNLRARLSLGFLLALLVAPLLPEVPAVDPLSLAGLKVAIEQVIIGVAMGFVAQMVFSAITQAGEMLALSMGLGFASIMDPAGGVQVPMLSQFLTILATLIFLALNGHLVLIRLLVLSFETLPIGAGGIGSDDLWALVNFGSTMFAGAVLIALPAMASLLLVNLAMGVVTRAAPQLNIFAVGFPVTLLMGFILLILTLAGLPKRLDELLVDAFQLIQQFLGV